MSGPLFAGYLYDTIGFFWICIAIGSAFLLVSPVTLIYLGDKKPSLLSCIMKVFKK